VASFTGALTVAPQSALALCNRGTCKMKTGDMEAALQDFNAALDIDAENIDCLMARGSVNRKLGCMAEAIYDFSRVIELQPCNSRAFFNRAMLYEHVDDLHAALTDCKRALNIDPLSSKSHFCLGVCLEREGDHAAALAALSRAIELEKNPAYFNARALIYDKLGQFGPCIDDFNTAIALDPTNDALLHNRGALCSYKPAHSSWLTFSRVLPSQKWQIRGSCCRFHRIYHVKPRQRPGVR